MDGHRKHHHSSTGDTAGTNAHHSQDTTARGGHVSRGGRGARGGHVGRGSGDHGRGRGRGRGGAAPIPSGHPTATTTTSTTVHATAAVFHGGEGSTTTMGPSRGRGRGGSRGHGRGGAGATSAHTGVSKKGIDFPQTLEALGPDDDKWCAWLKGKMAFWEANQIISEFGREDRHGPLWSAFCDCSEGKVPLTVLQLLANRELHKPEAISLFQAWAKRHGRNRLFEDGTFDADGIGCTGPHDESWQDSLQAAECLIAAILAFEAMLDGSMKQFSACIVTVDLAVKALAVTATPVLSARTTLLQERLETLLALKRQYMQRLKAETEARKIEAETKKRTITTHVDWRILDDPAQDSMYADIPVIPSPAEVLATGKQALPKNLVSRRSAAMGVEDDDETELICDAFAARCGLGAEHSELRLPSATTDVVYRSKDHLLNTHYLLLRQDCLDGLRDGIAKFRALLEYPLIEGVPSQTPTPDSVVAAAMTCSRMRGDGRINVYHTARVIDVGVGRQGITLDLSFVIPGVTVDWSKSNRFMTGNLLCLSDDGSFSEKHIVFATVARPVIPGSGKQPSRVTVSVDKETMSQLDLTSHALIIIESPVYFEAYKHVLQTLKYMRDEHVPFLPLLLGQNTEIAPPLYFRQAAFRTPKLGYKKEKIPAAVKPVIAGWNMSSVFPMFPTGHWDPLSQPMLPLCTDGPALDESQRKAMSLALSRGISLIQGPPGTGKTFVGVLIARILLANAHLRNGAPMLFVCQTNHALDQILEHVYEFDKRIVRIGGRSQSAIMAACTLNEAKKKCGKIARRREDYSALDERTGATTALYAAIEQRGCTFDDVTGRFNIPNTVLARLQSILRAVHQLYFNDISSAVNIIADLVDAAPLDALRAIYDEQAGDDDPSSWNDVKEAEFQEWMLLPPGALLRMASSSSSNATTNQLMTIWASVRPKDRRHRGTQKATDDWQTVGECTAIGAAKAPGPTAFSLASATVSKHSASAVAELAEAESENDMVDRLERTDVDEFSLQHLFEDFSSKGMSDEARRQAAMQKVVNRQVHPRVTNNIPRDQLALLRRIMEKGPWSAVADDRIAASKLFVQLLHKDADADFDQFLTLFEEKNELCQAFETRIETEALQSAAIIGMTTTGAAKHGKLLRSLGPEVVLVEEAAEVLESHILATLAPSVQHLIMIGDHQQLRPQVATYDLVKYHALDVSLFERLVSAGMKQVTLSTQRRMHPEISSLICPLVYKHLKDDLSTERHPTVRGMAQRVAFLSHSIPEDKGTRGDSAGISKSNQYEAEMITALLRHLLLNGYAPTQLVVLTMYLGQLKLIRKMFQKEDEKHLGNAVRVGRLSDVRISTTDNFQGEERDVVILSLVRSNAEGKIGFVGIPNRINVALSRARHGLYVIGNFAMLAERSTLWQSICEVVAGRKQLAEHWQLQCPNHMDSDAIEARLPGDFAGAPLGGCGLRCGGHFACGHPCKQVCHSLPHSAMVCQHKCEKQRPVGCTHACMKACGVNCGNCTQQVSKPRSCGHVIKVPCYVDPEDRRCIIKCDFNMPCGHRCLEPCHDHLTQGQPCKQSCRRTLACGHKCPKQCCEACGPCLTQVTRTMACGHKATVKCSVSSSDLPPCKEKCPLKLPCGHACPNTCGEPCAVECPVKRSTKVILCCKAPVKHVIVTACRRAIDFKTCKALCKERLSCGHECAGNCSECNQELTSSHVPCQQPCKGGCQHKPCSNPCAELCSTCHECSAAETMPAPVQICTEHPHADDSAMCNSACTKLLPRCGHPCAGICGERCPNICNSCEATTAAERRTASAKLTTIHPDVTATVQPFIELACGHIFTVDALDAWVGDGVRGLTCPQCGGSMWGVARYGQRLRQHMRSLEETKIKLLQNALAREEQRAKEHGVYGPLISHMERQLQHDRHDHPLQPLRRLILGEALLQLQDLERTKSELLVVLRNPRLEGELRARAHFALALAELGGMYALTEPVEHLREAQEATLTTALDHLKQAMGACTAAPTAELVMMLAKVEQALRPRRGFEDSVTLTPVSGPSEHAAVSPAVSADIPRLKMAADIQENGGNALHVAAVIGSVSDIEDLLHAGLDPSARDLDGNTALHLAGLTNNPHTFQALLRCSRWELLNKESKTALDIAVDGKGLTERIVRTEVAKASLNDVAGHQWAILRIHDKLALALTAMDELMTLTGLEKVKLEALRLIRSQIVDRKRPESARITAAYNFIFLGNPGTGKTTVARILGNLLQQLGLREGSAFVEKTGQEMLDDGSAKCKATIQSATPGVLFVDEVYQLCSGLNADGKAITNMLLSATEEQRDKLTVIVAGYRDDVDVWLESNVGLRSRFPMTFTFEDFDEKELESIFVDMVRSRSWLLGPRSSSHPVDISTIVGRRLARSKGAKGFANARTVRGMVEQSQRFASSRIQTNPALKGNDLITLLHEDVLGRPLTAAQLPVIQELNAMTGLSAVKKAVNGLLELVNTNLEREARGEKVQDVSLHRLFLGNPGTGKTSIAKLYGQALRELRLLSNGEHIVVGASKLIGDVVGSTQGNVNRAINSAAGKVLVIDEAYILATSMYGKEAIDTLVERVQGTAGEDFAVILCGYDKEMRDMLRDCNPGLSRRFKLEQAIMFEDYTDDELVSIMRSMVSQRGLQISETTALAAVRAVLVPQRSKLHFGNAGSVKNLIEAGILKMFERSSSASELIKSDLFDESRNVSFESLLSHLVHMEHVVKGLDELRNLVRREQAQAARDPTYHLDLSKYVQHYTFVGPPGTGKTTVARLFGVVFRELGLLPDQHVVEVKAQDLVGSYVGQTKDVVNRKMQEARGGVLFIDEAYGLNPRRAMGSYTNEALETLLANLTHLDYKGKLVVILAGYERDISDLLGSNPGLRSRFTESVQFHLLTDEQCVTLLHRLAADKKMQISKKYNEDLERHFRDCKLREGWANARDVETIFKLMQKSHNLRFVDDLAHNDIDDQDMKAAFAQFADQRAYVVKDCRIDVPEDPSSATRLHMLPTGNLLGATPALSAHETAAPAPKQTVVERPAEPQVRVCHDDGVEDGGDDDVLTCLESALATLGYSPHKCLDIVSTKDFPAELLELVASNAGGSIGDIRASLVRQCPRLVAQFRSVLEAIAAEEKRQIELLERIRRAAKEEAERLQREEAALQTKLRHMGTCPMGYKWLRSGGGYWCAGGSHFVTDAQLAAASTS